MASSSVFGDDSDSDDDFVSIGTAVQQIDEDEPLKKPTSVQDLTAKDKQGRRRFHGAFTGGFSAGYFNTVSTKEGFTPSAFVSSRSQKHDAASGNRPEDFMDDEDFEEHGIAPRKFVTHGTYTSEERKRKREADVNLQQPAGPLDLGSTLLNLITPQQLPIGTKLLRKMGWREGQGIGPRRVKKKKSSKLKSKERGAKVYGCALPPSDGSEDSDDFVPDNLSEVTFAPQDVSPIPLEVKDNVHGLGYSGLNPSLALPGSSFASMFSSTAVRSSSTKKGIRGQAFGVGAFEEDDDDIYAVDNMSNYNMALQEDDVADSNYGWTAPKQHGKQSVPVHYVGKLLEGFCLSAKSLPPKKKYPPPELPRNFRPLHWFRKKRNVSHIPNEVTQEGTVGSSQTRLTAVDRGLMLGEAPIMTSVFDLIPSQDKDRISATQEAIAMTKSLTSPNEGTEPQHRKTIEEREEGPSSSLSSKFKPAGMTSVSDSRADSGHGTDGSSKPMFPGSMSIQPFRREPAKQERYDKYLALVKQGVKDPYFAVANPSMTEWEKGREKEEFAKAAKIFRPLSAVMSTRFVNSGTMIDEKIVTSVTEKSEVSDEVKAAEMKMFGKLTRTEVEWHPDKLLCRRFNVPNPYPGSDWVGVPTVKRDKYSVFNFLSIGDYQPKDDPVPQEFGEENEAQKKELVPKKSKMTLSSVFEVLDDPNFHKPGAFNLNKDKNETQASTKQDSKSKRGSKEKDIVETQVKEEVAVNKDEEGVEDEDTAPSQDLFRAIFKNSDSEDSEESDKDDDKEEKDSSDNEVKGKQSPERVQAVLEQTDEAVTEGNRGRELIKKELNQTADLQDSSRLPAAMMNNKDFATDSSYAVNSVSENVPFKKPEESIVEDDDDEGAYGPKLPESFNSMRQAPEQSSVTVEMEDRPNSKRQGHSDSSVSSGKHRSRGKKHKKEKKKKSKHKKKEKKHKRQHSKKSKSTSRRSPDESTGSEADSESSEGDTDNELLDKLKKASKSGLSIESLTRR